MRARLFILLAIIVVEIVCTPGTIAPKVVLDSHKENEDKYKPRRTGKWKRSSSIQPQPQSTSSTSISTNDIITTEEIHTSQLPDDISTNILPDLVPEIKPITKFIAECDMPTVFGKFRMRSYTYKSQIQRLEPIVLISGDISSDNVIVRVHDQCFTGEIFGSNRCDCREQLHESMRLIKREGGIVIYLQQEGRGIGVSNKVAAYSLQDSGLDTVDANIQLGFEEEMREYNAVVDILKDMNIQSIRLVTNNPFKLQQLRSLGVQINERISIEIAPNAYNIGYLRSKRDRMRHIFSEHLTEGDQNPEQPEKTVVQTPEWNVPSTESASSSTGGQGVNSVSSSVAPPQSRYELEMELCAKLGSVRYAFGRPSVEAAIDAIRRGEMVLVVDDEGRENEGDFILAAEHATPANIGFIIRHSSGVLCVSLESERLEQLQLPPMVINNQDPKQTAYTVSVDYKHNTTTGISSADRAATFRGLADPLSQPDDFQRPGHCFPLRYKPGGVLARAGHTEASLDLARLAGCQPVAVLAEVVNDDGTVKRLDGLRELAVANNIVLTSVQDLIAYRVELMNEQSR